MDGNLARYVIDALMQQKGLGLPPLQEQIDAGAGMDVPMAPSNLDAFNRQQMMPDVVQLQTMQQRQPMTQMGGPEAPIPTGNISNKIQELVGAKPPQEENFLQRILSGRFELPESSAGPSFDNYSRAIQASAYGKPTSAQDYADNDLKQKLELLGTFEKLNGSTDFDKLINTYQAMPDTDPRKALYKDRITKETTPASLGIPIPVWDPRTNMPTYATREDLAGSGYMPPPPAGYKYGAGNKLIPTQPSTRDQMRLQDSVKTSDEAVKVERLGQEAINILNRYKTHKGALVTGTGEQILNVFPDSWNLVDKVQLKDFERLDKISKDLGKADLAQFGGNDTDKELVISIQTNVDPKAGRAANLETVQRKVLASKILQERPAFEEEWLNKNGSLSAMDVETGQSFTRAWMAHQKDMWNQGLAQFGSATNPVDGGQQNSGITPEQYNQLPSGAQYTAPDGTIRTKR